MYEYLPISLELINMNKKTKLPSGNLVLILFSVIIASSFIILIYTQTSGIEGFKIEMDSMYGQYLEVPVCYDITGDNISEIVIMVKPHYENDKINDPNYGMVKLYNLKSRSLIWSLDLHAPPIKLYRVFDYNNDGIDDLFLTYGTPNGTLMKYSELKYYPHRFGNSFISGVDGSVLKIDDKYENLTNEYVIDFLVYDENFHDNIEDFIVIKSNSADENSQSNVTAYYWNGTICKNLKFLNYSIRELEIINYLNGKHILATSYSKAFILNTSNPNNYSLILEISGISNSFSSFTILDDLNNDNCSELLIIGENMIKLVNGIDGSVLNYLNISSESINVKKIERINDINGDNKDDFLIYYYNNNNSNGNILKIIALNHTSLDIQLIHSIILDQSIYSFVPINNQYFKDNELKFLMCKKGSTDIFGSNSHILTSIDQSNTYWNYKSNYYYNEIKNISKIFDDSAGLILVGNHNLDIISIKGSKNYWLLFLEYPEYFGYFLIVLISIFLITIALILIFIKRTQFRKNISELLKYKENVKRLKLPIIITILIIIILIINFAFLNHFTGVFRTTLTLGSDDELVLIGIVFLFTVLFSSMPLLPAFYNKTAPSSSIAILELRKLFFKFIRHSEKKIVVINLDENKSIGIITMLKRCLLPILISLSVGINLFNFLAPKFSTVSIEFQETFYTFQYYFIYYAITPMIISFYLLFIFIPSTWLLDDAGVVYVITPKKVHLPPDIERLSNWAYNWLEGLAGFTAILSYINLISVLNMASFAINGDFLTQSMILIILGLLFYGFPFLSGLVLTLLSIIYMELNLEYNKEKLYKKMEKRNYDTKKKEIIFKDSISKN